MKDTEGEQTLEDYLQEAHMCLAGTRTYRLCGPLANDNCELCSNVI